jgi:predicted acylesterase/phospholipase RssA
MSAADSTLVRDAKANLVDDARSVLSGTYKKPAEILTLAKGLKEVREFGYARRILARARKDPAIYSEPKRVEIIQQSALCTYKDPDLPADRRLDRALEILREADDLSTTTNPETLGLVGAIYRRKWEVDNQKAQLERSLFYYLRGHAASLITDLKADQGYNGINAAYILDLLAHQEDEEADSAMVPPDAPDRDRIKLRREQARKIREEIAQKVAPLVDEKDTNWLQGKWWFYSTVAEAYFGLGPFDEKNYDRAVEWLNHGREVMQNYEVVRGVKGVPAWEFETTVRQLASLARLQADMTPRKPPPEEEQHEDEAAARPQERPTAGVDLKGTPAWRALEGFLGNSTPLHSAFYGKIGLGLSGGGFRASLFHLGVLAKLAELDVLRHVEVISCVSGGSIIGAHYYLELKRLLETKREAESDDEYRDERPADKRDWITHRDYIDLVERVEQDFLKGVQRNIRTRVAANPLTNLRMIFGSDRAPLRWLFGHAYSRTMRAGELYETEIFSRVKDGVGKGPRWMGDLRVRPLVRDASGRLDNDRDFNPKQGNWLRAAKVPILILNAAALNTGHSWHFTASYMGEPPAGIDSDIDGNDRLRRMYYEDAPEGHKCVRLGHAVAASACVQDVFEPLALAGLYPERVVRLVDGGTCDNQGVGGLLEQDCNVILISDGSGQMESVKDPSNGLLGVPLRSTSILQARIREAQFEDLSARRRSRLLRGLMFVHLKADLDVDPVDWIDCPDPFDTDDDDARPPSRRGKLTRYGIAKEIQQCLANVRTDLDSFSDIEAFTLMTSGYRQTEYAFGEGDCVENPEGEQYPAKDWDFLAVEDGMKFVNKKYKHVQALLGVSDMLAFKILKLNPRALALALLMLLAGLGLLVGVLVVVLRAAWRARNDVSIISAVKWAVLSVADSVRNALTNGVGFDVIAAVAVVVIVAACLLIAFFWKKGRGETLIRVVLAFAGILTSVVAQIHLHVFDRWFIREGSLEKYLRDTKSDDAPCAKSAPAGHAAGGAPPLPHPAAPRRGNGHNAPQPDAPAVEVAGIGTAVKAAERVAPARADGGRGHDGADGETTEGPADINDPDARQN